MSTKAPAKKTASKAPAKKVAAKKLSDREIAINFTKEVLKESKLPKEYKAFLLKACKEVRNFYLPHSILTKGNRGQISEIINYFNVDQTVEYGFDEDFWYFLSTSIEEFEDGDIEAFDLVDLPKLGTTKRFDMLDFPICVSSEEGLAVGCQSMDKQEFIQFLRDVAPVFGLKVVKK